MSRAIEGIEKFLYGRHFLLEMDAQTLVWLLNQPPKGLPNDDPVACLYPTIRFRC